MVKRMMKMLMNRVLLFSHLSRRCRGTVMLATIFLSLDCGLRSLGGCQVRARCCDSGSQSSSCPLQLPPALNQIRDHLSPSMTQPFHLAPVPLAWFQMVPVRIVRLPTS
jgi:hypothetical protein